MNTTENNKLMAEFLGFEQYQIQNKSNGYIINFNDGNVPYKLCAGSLKFHSDWNWLMEVVEKIFSEECIKPLAGNGMYYVLEIQIEEALKTAKIGAVYNACVEFIKWYNENFAKEN